GVALVALPAVDRSQVSARNRRPLLDLAHRAGADRAVGVAEIPDQPHPGRDSAGRHPPRRHATGAAGGGLPRRPGGAGRGRGDRARPDRLRHRLLLLHSASGVALPLARRRPAAGTAVREPRRAGPLSARNPLRPHLRLALPARHRSRRGVRRAADRPEGRRLKTVEVRGFGGPEHLAWIEAPPPRPGAGELLLRLAACGLNHADLLMRQGTYLGGPRPPFRPGMEAAGTVEEVGPGTPPGAPAPGMRVAAVAALGLQATHAVLPAAACVALPEGLPWEQAAALPVTHLTAYHALVTVARAEPGEVVLIHGAAGGLGSAAVQIARRLGLRVVATASTPEKRARARDLGAERVAGYEDFERAVREVTGGRGPDLVLETIGGEVMRRSLRLLPPLGRLVVLG